MLNNVFKDLTRRSINNTRNQEQLTRSEDNNNYEDFC